VHSPLGGGVDAAWAINAVTWLILFAAGAAWRFRLDTERV
jgi:ABC-2 type transport system permease protein